MTNELTLADLHDIAEPAAVPAWPPAPGIWVVLAMAIVAVGLLVLYKWKVYQRNAYRREALAELDGTKGASRIAEILRRTALTAYPRDVVVGLKGDDWFQWLEREGGIPCPEDVRQIWEQIYSNDEVESEVLKNFTQEWITKHAGV